MTKTKELKNFEYHGETHIGNVRNENEDAFAYIDSVNGSLFVICDGMGGIKGGKLAAETAVEEIKRCFSLEWFDNPKDLLTESVIRANTAVFNLFPEAIMKPGTTVILALIRNNKIWYAHAGDSRIYYYSGKKLFQLTRDHSYVANLVEQKILSEEEALNHPRKNEITKAIGIHAFIDPSICPKPIETADNDYLLLCSDGLINELSKKEVSQVLSEESNIQHKTEELLKKALDKGGVDNITLQLVRFFNTGREEREIFLPPRKKEERTRKYKLITLFFSIVIIISFFFLIRDFIKIKKTTHIEKAIKSNLNVKINNKKDTLRELFLLSTMKTDEISKRFNIHISELGYESVNIQHSYKKYFIPVVSINLIGISPALYSSVLNNSNSLINIMIANRKNELYFKPGEVLIFPKEE